MTPSVQYKATLKAEIMKAEIADLRRQLECLEAVALELIAERDRAVADLERLSQLSLA